MLRHDPTPVAEPFTNEDPGPAADRPQDGLAREAPPAGEDPSRLSGPELVALVVERHHAYARRALPYVVALLGKVTARHRARNAKLATLCDAGEELADALESCQDEEERDLFPALAAGVPVGEAVRLKLDAMYRRHRELRLLLVRIRWLADDFTVPDWAGRTYGVLMEELEALEANLLEHIHLERVLLGPRLSCLC
ncbi:MAG TPA: hemerythrin domain-containing protein [Anaeromyxobacteraceae bacterium]|nr:hemerythrin domain-containing protein [Anaeromyxobacteraceae bacterium]